ncbi:MAG: Drug resistance transporter, EmrB/QacA subfamily, partial [Pedosphaera sp.]|nr:Drug resistance transporter, EmrB/QacA subfamily [Pedosphaera sp.]
FSGANLVTLFLYMALAGALFFLPLNLIQVQDYKPMAAGAAVLPLVLIVFFLSRWSGGLVKRYGARLPLVAGPAVAALGFALFTVPGIGGSYWTSFFPAVVVLGLGLAVSVAPLTTTVMNAVGKNRAGVASGINNAMSRVAGLLAIAALGLVMLHVFNSSLDRRLSGLALAPETRRLLDQERGKLAGAEVPGTLEPGLRVAIKSALDESFVSGFRRVMLESALLALLSSFVAGRLIDREKVTKALVKVIVLLFAFAIAFPPGGH